MNKKSMVKYSSIGLLVLILISVFFVFFLPKLSSAITDKSVYVLGEKVRIKAQAGQVLKITTPSTSYTASTNQGSILFTPKETGKYYIEIKGTSQRYEFEVIGQNETQDIQGQAEINKKVKWKKRVNGKETEYETDAPRAEETKISNLTKEVKIFSPPNLSYTNVLAYTSIDEIVPVSMKDLVKVYWKDEDKYLEFNASDTNNNGLIDRVEWVVPHLSNQTFEVYIEILNVQSYPVLGGNWQVNFRTVGKADLTVTAVNGTTWSSEEGDYDLRFLEIRCGDKTLNSEWVNGSVLVRGYECNETGSEISRVLTSKKHHLEFDFGGMKAYAHNDVTNATMILFWNGTSDAPAGWTCISCRPGDPFYRRFPRGNTTYGGPGGVTNQSHTATISLIGNGAGSNRNTGAPAENAPRDTHTHGSTVNSVSNESNLPAYGDLKIIAYNSGIPEVIPTGVIAVFNTSILPSGWVRYALSDQRIVQGENDTLTGGSNSHSQTVNITLTASALTRAPNSANQANVPPLLHTHSLYSTTPVNGYNTPLFITVVLAIATSDNRIPNNMIAMFNDTLTGPDWTTVSNSSSAFYGRFIMSNATYGVLGGNATHTHPDFAPASGTYNGAPLSITSSTSVPRTSVATNAHTHTVTMSFSTETNLPPYLDVIFGQYKDRTPPRVTIVNPANTTLTISSIDFNFTLNEPGTCWYSLNGGVTNYSMTANSSNTGFGATNASIADGQYTVRAYCNDSTGNNNFTETRVFIKDALPPYFTSIPAPVVITYLQGFQVDFSAVDAVGFDSFSINWTTLFSINRTGTLKNSTLLPAGNYYINVTVNDTSNNKNSTIYNVTVNKINSQTSLTLDKTSPQIYGTQITPTCSLISGIGAPALTLNGTTITSGQAITLGGGIWDFNCSIAESENYTGASNFSQFTINPANQTITPLLNGQNSNLVITYPQQFNASYSGTNYTNLEIRVNSTLVDRARNYTWKAGNYFIVNYSAPSNQNYSAFSALLNLTINQATGSGTLLLNNTAGDINGVYSMRVNASFTNLTNTAVLLRNGAGITGLNNVFQDLAAGFYNFTLNLLANENYTSFNISRFANITKAVPVLTFLANSGTNNLTLVYPAQVNMSAVASSGSIGLDRNNISVLSDNAKNVTLAAGSYIYRANITGNENYSDVGYSYYTVTINKSNGSASLRLNNLEDNLTVQYPQQSNLSALTLFGNLNLYFNGVNITSENNLNVTRASGFYNITAVSSGNENYTQSSITRWLNITKAGSLVYTYLNNSRANVTINAGDSIWLNSTRESGEGEIRLYSNGSLINSGNSLLANYTQFNLGLYNITTVYEETQNYTRSFETWWVSVSDTIPPGVAIVYPLAVNYSANVSNLNYTYYDFNPGYCWYSLNNGQTNLTSQSAGTNFSSVTSVEGWNNWSVYCNDSVGNQNSSNVSFFKDTTYPLVSFGSGVESNNASFYRSWIFVNVTLNETNFGNITFSLYNSSSIVNQTTFFTPVYTVNWTVLQYNNYTYNVSVADIFGNTNSTETRAITLLPANINLITPLENSGDNDGNITFYYNLSAEESIVNCSLWINDSINQTNQAIDTSTNNSFNISLGVGSYLWKILCYIVNGYLTTSEQRTVTVVLTTNFGGDTTDLFYANVSDIQNFTVQKLGVGKIVFDSPVNLSGGADINALVLIDYNNITVDTNAEPRLNKSARLLIENLSYETVPIILKDGEFCDEPDCIVESYENRNLTFNVTGFSSYVSSKNSLLGIWDETDPEGGSNIRYEFNQVKFFANYTEKRTGAPIQGASVSCNITFNISGAWTLPAGMGYNSTLKLYTYNRTFAAAGIYNWNVSCRDSSPGAREPLSTNDTVSITADTVYPLIEYGFGTEISGVNLSSTSIFVNVTVNETNFANITFSLYNSSSIVNQTTFFTPVYTINWTSLPDTNYTYNVSVSDLVNHRNSTETRAITLDATYPKIEYGNGTLGNDSVVEQDWIFVNVTVNETNFANITFELYNNTGGMTLVNRTVFTSQVFTINWTNLSSLNVTYYYNVSVSDFAGNRNATLLRTIKLADITNPSLILYEPVNTTYYTNQSIVLNYNASDVHLDTCWYNLNSGSNQTLSNCQGAVFDVPEGSNTLYLFVNDSAGNMNMTSVTFIANSSLIYTPDYYVQRGLTLVNNVQDVPIERVDVAKSFILYSVRNGTSGAPASAPNAIQVTSKFVNASTIRFENYNGGNVLVSWEVITGPDLRVQRNELAYGSAAGQDNFSVGISSVDNSKSFIIVNNRLNTATAASNVQGFWTGRFLNSTTINLQRGAVGSSGNVSWQVVEWQGTSVFSGSSSGTGTSASFDIGGSVDMNNSFLIFSSRIASGTTLQDTIIGGFIANTTSVAFYKAGGTATWYTEWFVVSWNRIRSQRGSRSYSTPVNLDVPVNRLYYTNKSFNFISRSSTGGATTFANSLVTSQITNTTNLLLYKGTVSNTHNVSWQAMEIIELQPPFVNLFYPQDNQNFSSFSVSQFNYSILDNSSIENCSLLGNWTGSFTINQTVSNPQNGTISNFSSVDTGNDGFYIWNVECTDVYGNTGRNSTNFTFSTFLFPGFPENITSLESINDGTGNLTLAWNSSAHQYQYKIYYTTNLVQNFTFLGASANTSYLDVEASGNRTRFYKVSAFNPAGENASNTFVEKTVYYLKQKAGVNTRNWIGFPFNSSLLRDANSTLWEILNATTFNLWNETAQKRVSCNLYLCPSDIDCTPEACNFQISAGRGYEAHINSSAQAWVNWSATGLIYPQVSINLLINSTSFGKNWVSMYANTTLRSAKNLVGNISYADAVTDWDANQQTSKGLVKSSIPSAPYIGTNFSIETEKAYEVSVTQNSSFNQI